MKEGGGALRSDNIRAQVLDRLQTCIFRMKYECKISRQLEMQDRLLVIGMIVKSISLPHSQCAATPSTLPGPIPPSNPLCSFSSTPDR